MPGRATRFLARSAIRAALCPFLVLGVLVLYYVFADERDVIALRTNHRQEKVFLLPTRVTRQEARDLLVDILEECNRLAEHPPWYRTLGRNCTTSLVSHLNRVQDEPTPPLQMIFMNGYLPRDAYARGLIDTDLSFREYVKTRLVNPAANAYGDGPGFSRKIRESMR